MPAAAVLVAGVLGIGLIIGFLFGSANRALEERLRDDLRRMASVVASTVDREPLAELADPSLTAASARREVLEPLLRAQGADDRIRRIWTAVPDGDGLRIVVDTQAPGAPGAVIAGDRELVAALEAPAALIASEPTRMPDGVMLSAYARLADADGVTAAVLGLDFEISRYVARLERLRRAGYLTGAFGFVLVLGGALGIWLTGRSKSEAREMSRQLRTVNALLDVSRALGGEIKLPSLLPIVMAKVSEVLDAERSSLFLYDRDGECLRGLVTQGVDNEWFNIPIDRGLAGRVVRTGEVVNVADAYQDPDFNPEFDRQSGFRTRSVLAMPVRRADGELIGVTQALNRRDGQPFDRDDETLLGALMAQAAVAIERARLTDAWLEKELIDEALRLAHDIQMNMLPRDFETVSGEGMQIYASLTPAKAIGGDFYDLFVLDDGRLCFVVADVSGKGIPAALFMAQAKTLINALARSGLSAAGTLERANDVLCQDNHASMFVTVFLAFFDPKTGTLVYANAGHNLPCRITPDGTVSAVAGAEAIALGAMDGFPFEEETLTLSPGDTIYLYTDGVNEAMNEEDEEFTQERLEAVLRDSAGASAAQVARATIGAVKEHCGNAEASDDLTVLVFRWLGSVRERRASGLGFRQLEAARDG